MRLLLTFALMLVCSVVFCSVDKTHSPPVKVKMELSQNSAESIIVIDFDFMLAEVITYNYFPKWQDQEESYGALDFLHSKAKLPNQSFSFKCRPRVRSNC